MWGAYWARQGSYPPQACGGADAVAPEAEWGGCWACQGSYLPQAWCHGHLTGDLTLRPQPKPVSCRQRTRDRDRTIPLSHRVAQPPFLCKSAAAAGTQTCESGRMAADLTLRTGTYYVFLATSVGMMATVTTAAVRAKARG